MSAEWWLAAGFAVVGLLLVPHNLRAYRARRDARKLPPEALEKALGLLAGLQPAGPQQLLRPGEVEPSDSRIGGSPALEQEGRFLLQVRLDNPSLPACWQGRLVVVHLLEGKLRVASLASALSAPGLPGRRLLPLPLPEGEDSFQPQLILERTPGLAEHLVAYGRPSDLVVQILSPASFGYEIGASSVILCGGRPALIQDEHPAACPECRAPMRFLLQFGEVFQGLVLGDAGVGYVYGCDLHPDRVLGFLDSA